jgi:hypothetical protein
MKKFCLLLAVLIFSGCAHSGTEKVKQETQLVKPELSTALVSEAIVKGKTTREELIAKLGPPNSVAKRPYHVPKVNVPGIKLQIPPEMMAVETWNYWTVKGGVRSFLVEFYIDETGTVLDYKIDNKELRVDQPPA